MYRCTKCNSHRIKTRTNVSYGKGYSTPVNCKDCGSLSFEKLDKKNSRNFKKRR